MTDLRDNGRCPHCNNRVLQKSGSVTKLRIKGGVFINEDGSASAQCHWCRNRIVVPVVLEKADVDEESFTFQKTDA